MGLSIFSSIIQPLSFYRTCYGERESEGFLAGFILAFNFIGNKSPGVIDNGSAVAVLLSLMEYIKTHPLPGINLTFLFTAAEEVGLTGALAFVKNRKDLPEWDPKKTAILNYNIVGLTGSMILLSSMGVPRKESSKVLNRHVMEIVHDLGLSITSAYLPMGAWTDHLPFLSYGYQCAIISSVSGAWQFIHTSKDLPNLAYPDHLFDCFLLGVEFFKRLQGKQTL